MTQPSSNTFGAADGSDLFSPPFPKAVRELRSKLVQNDYRPVGIKNGEKRPLDKDWQIMAKLGFLPPENTNATGTGILCEGLRAVDIDIDNLGIAGQVCTIAQEMLGVAPIRCRENSSRCALIYRASEDAPKKRSLSGSKGSIEILGTGQQLMAYGNHPSGVALRWHGGEPSSMHRNDLTAVSEQQIDDFLDAVADLIGAKRREQKPKQNGMSQADLSERFPIDLLEELIFHIDPDCGYDEWNKVSMAVHFETSGSEDGLELVDRWSSGSKEKYKGRSDVEYHWKSFECGKGVTGRTLAHLAREHGADLSEIARRRKYENFKFPDIVENPFNNSIPANLAAPVPAPTDIVPYEITMFADIELNPVKDWMIEGLVGAGELAVFYGAPGSGKSTLVGDAAFHIAAGKDWFGRRTKKCSVLFVAAERPALVKRRFAAHRKRYQIDDISLAIVQGYFDMSKTKTDTDRIIVTIRELERRTGEKPGVVIIDTKAQVIGDDNSSLEVNTFVGNVARIQNETGVTVIVIDHSAFHTPKKMRGHTALLGAADLTYMIEKNGNEVFTAKIEKANDAEQDQPIAFRMESVTLGTDPKSGTETTAPVVVETRAPGGMVAKKLPPSVRIAKEALHKAINEFKRFTSNEHYSVGLRTARMDDWRECAYKMGISDANTEESRKKAFNRAKNTLLDKKIIGIWDDCVWLSNKKSQQNNSLPGVIHDVPWHKNGTGQDTPL